MARVLLGVGGGIAAYKVLSVARGLREAGHSVRVIPTQASLHFVGAASWEALTGEVATADVFAGASSVDHVRLGTTADLLVIAPATANLMARAAAGLADDLLTCTYLVTTAPVLMAPAMHTQMWQAPATVANADLLRQRGVRFIGPETGRLTGPDTGPGRMSEPDTILAAALAVLAGDDLPEADRLALAGKRVLITAGGTREAIDPVRFLGNASSGRQGLALAAAAVELGAEVTLVAANVTLSGHEYGLAQTTVKRIDVVSAAELLATVLSLQAETDIIVMAAAVADFQPTVTADTKMKRAGVDSLALSLKATVDVLGELAARRQAGQVLVAFAAETGDDTADALTHGGVKARSKDVDLTVVNQVGPGLGIGTADNEVWVLDRAGNQLAHSAGSKLAVGRAVMSVVCATVLEHEST